MALFDGINISKENKQQILLYLDNPTLEHWNKIAKINLTDDYQLWRIVMRLKMGFVENYINYRWTSYPDAITLVRAIKKFIQGLNKQINYFKPAA